MLIDKLKLEIRKLFFPIAYALQVEKEKEQEKKEQAEFAEFERLKKKYESV